MENKGKIVILSAPSGAGKTSICKLLLERNSEMKLSVSATTRPPREMEKDTIDYFFLSQEEFLQKLDHNEFWEHEKVHGYYYGTLKKIVDDFLKKGKTILFDIDVNGALNLKKSCPEALLIFIHPPSANELEKRLKERNTEDSESVKTRLSRISQEYSKSALFDYEVINKDLLDTTREIERLIRSE